MHVQLCMHEKGETNRQFSISTVGIERLNSESRDDGARKNVYAYSYSTFWVMELDIDSFRKLS